MSTELPAPPDLRVSLSTPQDVQYWTRMDCSEGELRRAVHAVGHSAQAIREMLQSGPA